MKATDREKERHAVLLLLEYSLLHDGKALELPMDIKSLVRARMQRLGMSAELAGRPTGELYDKGVHPLLTAIPDDIEEMKSLAQLAQAKRKPAVLAEYGKRWGPGPGIWRSNAPGATERFLPCPLPEGWIPTGHRTDGGMQLEIANTVLTLTVSEQGRLFVMVGATEARPNDADVEEITGQLRRCRGMREIEDKLPARPELGISEHHLSKQRCYVATIGDKPMPKWGRKRRRKGPPI